MRSRARSVPFLLPLPPLTVHKSRAEHRFSFRLLKIIRKIIRLPHFLPFSTSLSLSLPLSTVLSLSLDAGKSQLDAARTALANLDVYDGPAGPKPMPAMKPWEKEAFEQK